jgi:hypothetical protein
MFGKRVRVPVWASLNIERVVDFRATAERFWKSRLVGFVLIIAAMLVVGYWHLHIPVPGKAVAALAVTAAVMTVRSEMSGIEKFLWMGVLFAFLFIEVRSIDKDRDDNNNQQIEARRKLDENFSGVLKQNRDAFNATMGKMNNLADQAHQNLCEIDGCDSFCYMVILPPTMPVFIHVGKYPLSNVEAKVTDVMLFKDRVKRGATLSLTDDLLIKPGDIAANGSWAGFGVSVPFSSLSKQDFNIDMTAKNGSWTELLRMRKIDGVWEQAIRVRVNVRPSNKNKRMTSKQVLEQISKNFPVADLKADRDWSNSHKATPPLSPPDKK